MSLFNLSPRIGIVGSGYVGKAMFTFFKDHYPVVIYDVNPSSYTSEMMKAYLTTDKYGINKCDIVVVCVSTPMGENGECDLSHVNSVFEWLKAPLVILKSTVPPGTTRKLRESTGLRIVHSPEYISESTYDSPYEFHTSVKKTPWFIFGGETEDTNKVVDLYMPIVGPAKTIREVDSDTSEFVKYVENVFYSIKVLFCYEIANMCKLAGINYNDVRDLWTLDPRLSDAKMHTAVFEKNDKPFGGKCLLPSAKIKVNGEVMSLKDFYDLYNKTYDTYTVESTNFDINNIEQKEIKEIYSRNISEEILEFETENGIFSCTKDHLMPVFRNNEKLLLKASEIIVGDELYSSLRVTEYTFQVSFEDELNLNFKKIKVNKINVVNYKGEVFNLELKSENKKDDLFFVEQDTGIVTHNCFPKDINSFVNYAESLGYDAALIKEAITSNDRIGEFRKNNRGNNG